MSLNLSDILALSIVIVALIAIVRFRYIHAVFTPFLLLMWVDLFQEAFSVIIIKLGYYNIYNFNIYLLVSSLIIAWQFYRWNLYRSKNLYHAILAVILLAYAVDEIWLTGFHNFNAYFHIFRSTLVVMLSINMINKVISTERGNLLRQPIFLICCAFVLFFTQIILEEVFWLYGKRLDQSFLFSLHHIIVWINPFCNLVFALAVLWMPRRIAFSLPY